MLRCQLAHHMQECLGLHHHCNLLNELLWDMAGPVALQQAYVEKGLARNSRHSVQYLEGEGQLTADRWEMPYRSLRLMLKEHSMF